MSRECRAAHRYTGPHPLTLHMKPPPYDPAKLPLPCCSGGLSVLTSSIFQNDRPFLTIASLKSRLVSLLLQLRMRMFIAKSLISGIFSIYNHGARTEVACQTSLRLCESCIFSLNLKFSLHERDHVPFST